MTTLTHKAIWHAIDMLAEKNGLSVSRMAIKAGLNSTTFNKSKRHDKGRERWPSTESIAQVLDATHTTLDEFALLAEGATPAQTLPLIGFAQAGREGFFDEAGYPVGNGWDEVELFSPDPRAFAVEISGKDMEPLYRDGDRVIVSPAADVRRNDRVMVWTNAGKVMVKRLHRQTKNDVELASFNPQSPDLLKLARRDIRRCCRIVWASQ